MANPILNLGNNEWATKSESLLGYSKSGSNFKSVPFTHSRASVGTTTDRNGVVETILGDTPRIDFQDNEKGALLLEPQRTNLILYSEEFSGSNWVTLNTLINSDTVISPNGTMTANTLQRTSTSASYRSHNISKSASAITYTTSAFIKKGSDDYFSMRAQGSYPSRADFRFRFDTEEIYYTQAFSNFTILDYGVENYSNGWYRLHFTYTSDTHTNLSITFSPRSTDGNIDNTDTSDNSFAYVWGAQTEVANYVSSYIKTEASAVTRLKDECSDGGDADLFNLTEGTLFVDTTPFTREATDRITLSNNNYNNRILISKSSSTQLQFIVVSNNSTVATYTTNVNYNERNKIAITFKQNEFKFYLNSSLVHTDTSGSVPTGLNDFSFKGIGSALYWNGKIHQAMIFNEALSDIELQTLTTL